MQQYVKDINAQQEKEISSVDTDYSETPSYSVNRNQSNKNVDQTVDIIKAFLQAPLFFFLNPWVIILFLFFFLPAMCSS